MDNKSNSYVLSENIRKARRNGGYKSQQAFADALIGRDGKPVNLKTVQYWESGKTKPDLDSLIRICDLLNVDLDYLIGRIDKPTHDIQFISDETGLSTEAVQILQEQKKTETPAMLSRIIGHRLFVQLMRMICKLSKPQVFTRLFADSVINHLTNDGVYTDSPDDIRAIYANQTSRTFDRIVDDIIKP